MQTLRKDCTFDGCCQLLGAVVQRAKADGEREWLSQFLDGIAGNEKVLSSVAECKAVAAPIPLKQVSLRKKRSIAKKKAKKKNAAYLS